MPIRCRRCGTDLLLPGFRCPEGLEPRPCMAPDGTTLVGRLLADRYTLLEVKGVGGMGTVFRAKQESMGRDVAVKILPRHLADDEQAISQFAHEARVLGRLNEPHTVAVYDFGQTEDGLLFLVMELLKGRSLSRILRLAGPMAPRRALPITRQIADSLQNAHANGIIHRDVKADNVFLTDNAWSRDVVKVLDFGIAVLARGRTGTPDADGIIVGTPEAVSPEQVLGLALDARTDVYSTGALLYQLLTGHPPVEGETPEAIFRRKAAMESPPRLRERHPEMNLPQEVDDLVAGMMEPDREKRPASMKEVRAALTRIMRALDAPSARAEPQSSFRRMVEAVRGRPATASAGRADERYDWSRVSLALRCLGIATRAYRQAADECRSDVGRDVMRELAVLAASDMDQVREVIDLLAEGGSPPRLQPLSPDSTRFDMLVQRLMTYSDALAFGGDSRGVRRSLEESARDLRAAAAEWDLMLEESIGREARQFAEAMRLLAWDHVARLDELVLHLQRRQERTGDTMREKR